MYFLYTKKYSCMFIVFSRCCSKTLISWIADLEEIDRPKNHNECIQNKNICMSFDLYNAYSNPRLNLDNERLQDLKKKYISEEEITNILRIEKIKELLKGYSIYIIVRNPLDRLLSATISHHCHDNYTYKEFVELFIKTGKLSDLKYSTDLIKLIIKNIDHKILHFDKFEFEIKSIIKKHNIPINPGYNKEFNYIEPDIIIDQIYNIKMVFFDDIYLPHYTYFYDKESINIVYEKFKEDFDLFGFKISI